MPFLPGYDVLPDYANINSAYELTTRFPFGLTIFAPVKVTGDEIRIVKTVYLAMSSGAAAGGLQVSITFTDANNQIAVVVAAPSAQAANTATSYMFATTLNAAYVNGTTFQGTPIPFYPLLPGTGFSVNVQDLGSGIVSSFGSTTVLHIATDAGSPANAPPGPLLTLTPLLV